MEELKSYLDSDGFSSTKEYYPVDAVEPVTMALSAAQKECERRRISIRVDRPSSQVLVQAMRQELSRLVEVLLRILINDAFEDTQITISVIPGSLEVVYQLTNSGYGMPDDDFQRYLQKPELATSDLFAAIGHLRPTLALWRAELKGSSEVGKGIHFTLRLVRSLLSE